MKTLLSNIAIAIVAIAAGVGMVLLLLAALGEENAPALASDAESYQRALAPWRADDLVAHFPRSFPEGPAIHSAAVFSRPIGLQGAASVQLRVSAEPDRIADYRAAVGARTVRRFRVEDWESQSFPLEFDYTRDAVGTRFEPDGLVLLVRESGQERNYLTGQLAGAVIYEDRGEIIFFAKRW